MQLTFDFHNHSPLSRCSKKNYTVTEMLETMKSKGYTRVGISDHYYFDETIPAEAVKYAKDQAKNVPGIEFFSGVEVDMLAPGILDADYATLSPYDYIQVAAPHWHNPRIARPIVFSNEALAQEQYDMMVSFSAFPFVDAIVHPFTFYPADAFGMTVDQVKLMSFYTKGDYDRIIDVLLNNDIAVELHRNLAKPDYTEGILPFLRQCVSRGVHFSLGSDAHELSVVGSILGVKELIDSLHIPDELAFVPHKNVK